MNNNVGVVLFTSGAGLCAWGMSGSVRAAAAVGGLLLALSALLLLIDFGGDA